MNLMGLIFSMLEKAPDESLFTIVGYFGRKRMFLELKPLLEDISQNMGSFLSCFNQESRLKNWNAILTLQLICTSIELRQERDGKSQKYMDATQRYKTLADQMVANMFEHYLDKVDMKERNYWQHYIRVRLIFKQLDLEGVASGYRVSLLK